MNIKASDLQRLSEDIVQYIYHDFNSGMIIGCDCGCGGDFYDDPEAVQAAEEEYDTLIESIEEECQRLGIQNDLT